MGQIYKPGTKLSSTAGENNGTLVGKRYTDEAESMEFLCTRGGDGSVSVNGTPLDVKAAKKLPSSD